MELVNERIQTEGAASTDTLNLTMAIVKSSRRTVHLVAAAMAVLAVMCSALCSTAYAG